MNDEQQRIRSYLQAQGAKLTPVDIIAKVRAAMDEVHAAATAVPAGRFQARPAAGEWSANEVMAHVVAAGARFGRAITDALDGTSPGAPIADAAEQGVPQHTADAWWTDLVNARAKLFERVLAADPRTHLDIMIEHPFFGPLNWRECLLFFRLHDLDHAGQLRKIADGPR